MISLIWVYRAAWNVPDDAATRDVKSTTAFRLTASARVPAYGMFYRMFEPTLTITKYPKTEQERISDAYTK